jgi:hypothetical protein
LPEVPLSDGAGKHDALLELRLEYGEEAPGLLPPGDEDENKPYEPLDAELKTIGLLPENKDELCTGTALDATWIDEELATGVELTGAIPLVDENGTVEVMLAKLVEGAVLLPLESEPPLTDVGDEE